MAIERIDIEKCNGCGTCIESCIQDVIRLDKNDKAAISYPEDCMSCLYCEIDCPTGAVYCTPERNFPPLIAWR